jgi:hypothetical protein
MLRFFVKGCILFPVSLHPSLFDPLLNLHHYSDITG